MLWAQPWIEAAAEVLLRYYLNLSLFECGSVINAYRRFRLEAALRRMITVWHQSTAREKIEQTDPMSLSLYFGPVPNVTHHVHLRSYGLTMADVCAFLISPFLILAFRRVLASAPFVAIMCPRSALLPSPHWCKLAADFYPTVKAALRHESADSEEDREGLGGHLGQGLLMWYYGDHSAQMCSYWSSSADRPVCYIKYREKTLLMRSNRSHGTLMSYTDRSAALLQVEHT